MANMGYDMTWENRVLRTIGEIAQYLQLSESSVKRRIREKKLPVRWDGGTWVMTSKDYQDWLDKKSPAR